MDRRGFFKALAGLAAVPMGLMVGLDKAKPIGDLVSVGGAELFVGDAAGKYWPVQDLPNLKFFEIGDVVRLNSGGPEMKVFERQWSFVNGNAVEELSVSWSNEDGTSCVSRFPSACLTKVEPGEGTVV